MSDFFSSAAFMPHGHCYLWKPALLWLQVSTNALIGLAYVAIAGTLVLLVWRVRDVPFRWVYLAFGVFIVACGVTHFSDVWVIWDPQYWVDSGIRAVTAVASVATAVALPPLVPKVAALARGAQAARRRGVELETMMHDLEHLYERTKEVEEQKTRFFAYVSHELRTPITLILGPVQQLLADETLDPAKRRELEVVRRNAQTLLKHVNDLLDVARLEAGAVRPEYVRGDVAERVRAAAAHFDALAAERKITCRLETPPALEAEVDLPKFERAAVNLLSNAFKFTPPGGVVRCRLAAVPADGGREAAARRDAGPTARAREEARIVLEVADSGPGIPPAERERVFERFRQLDGAPTRAFGGTGLGLAMTREFLELHGGRVRVEDAPEGGALLRAELPRFAPEGATVRQPAIEEPPHADAALAAGALEVEALAAAAPSSETEPAPAAADDARRPLVLVVEDNPDMNRFVRESLASDHRTVSARDGREGLEKAAALRPDLVVCDVMMPVLAGDELVAALRSRPELASLPVLVLTARSEGELPARLLGAGAQDFLAKPFSVPELRARVRNLVAMKRARDVLERELERRTGTLEELAQEVTAQKRSLGTALDAVRVARDQAERASQLKTNLLRLVSHELRTPLAILNLQLERFEADPSVALDTPRQEVVQRIRDAARRLGMTVDSLLEHARIESGRIELEASAFAPGAVAAEVLDEFAPLARRSAVELRLAPPAEEAGEPEDAHRRPFSSDPRLVRLVLANLVSNALKFTERGAVDVAVARDGNELRIAVSDTGRGIAPEEHERIFEPFQQLEPTRRKHEPGVGLGLSLVRDIVRALGGRLELRSQPGRGSTFTVLLPELPPDRSAQIS